MDYREMYAPDSSGPHSAHVRDTARHLAELIASDAVDALPIPSRSRDKSARLLVDALTNSSDYYRLSALFGADGSAPMGYRGNGLVDYADAMASHMSTWETWGAHTHGLGVSVDAIRQTRTDVTVAHATACREARKRDLARY